MSETLFKGEDVRDLVQIAGLIRFSYPSMSGGDGYNARYDSREAQLAALYSETRMEERFVLFENVCLHSLKHQSCKNFRVGVLAGEDMPAPYLARLQALVDDVPEVELIILPVLPYREALDLAFERLFVDDTPFRMTFRIDDDDAVSLDYIEKINAYLPQMLMMTSGLNPVCLTFTAGLTVLGSGEARKAVASNAMSPRSVGVSVLAPTRWRNNVFLTSHPRLHGRMSTIFDVAETVILRIFHNSNDSEAQVPGQKKPYSDDKVAMILRERFALDMKALLAL